MLFVAQIFAIQLHFFLGSTNALLNVTIMQQKDVFCSLLHTADDGIWYWHTTPHLDLPPGQHEPQLAEDVEKDFLILNNPYLVGAMDNTTKGPNLLNHQSICASFILLGLLGLVAYYGILQPLVTTDSACAGEFIQ